MASRTLGYPTKTAEQVGRTNAGAAGWLWRASPHCPRNGRVSPPSAFPGQASESCPSRVASSNATHADTWRGGFNLNKKDENMTSNHRLSITLRFYKNDILPFISSKRAWHLRS